MDGSGGDENEAVSNGTSNESGIAGLYADDEAILSSVIFDEDVVNGSIVYIDGAVVATFTSDHGGEASSSLQIGAQGNGSNGFMGEIAEVIVYDQLLTSSSDREKIESYLAIKYGITLSENSDSDGNTYEAGEGDYLFSTGAAFWDADEVVGFQNNVAGIARDDASCLNQNNREVKIVVLSFRWGLMVIQMGFRLRMMQTQVLLRLIFQVWSGAMTERNFTITHKILITTLGK